MRTLPQHGESSQFERCRRAVIRAAKAILLERLNDRLGSQAVIRRHHQEGLLPKVKQTKLGPKRTWA